MGPSQCSHIVARLRDKAPQRRLPGLRPGGLVTSDSRRSPVLQDKAIDYARASAGQPAAALARGERAPLLGVPMTVKEAFKMAGLPATWGVEAFAGWTPAKDAVVVERLKAAGAVIVGKTNVCPYLGDWQAA